MATQKTGSEAAKVVKPAIPDYELIRAIGRGSYGDVWLARGLTGVFRAVKVVWRERFADPQPFEREFKGLREFTAVSLVEAHQLALLHVGRNDEAGFFYYVMELADDAETGREIDPDHYVPLTLREMRVRRGRLPSDRCIALAADLTRALAGLHSRKLVHRDIKPSNVIIVGGVAKLADIGLVASTTEALTFVGTEGFVPPEGPGAPSADVYSLGKLIYELSSGRDRTEFPSLPQDLDSITDRKKLLELNEVVVKACDPSPAKRYPDAGAMLQDILLLQAGQSVRRLRFVERRLKGSLQMVAVLTTVAAIAAGGAYVERKRLAAETERRREAEAALENLARMATYSATVSHAQKDLESGNYGVARTVLKQAIPVAGQTDMRDFEWRALWNEAKGDPATLISESGPALVRVRYSPDGSLLAGQDDSGAVTVWNLKSGRLQQRLQMPIAPTLSGFSEDGRWLLGVNEHLALQRWSLADGSPEPTSDKVTNRPLAPIGASQVLSFSGSPHRLRIWDFERKAEVASIAIPHAGKGEGTFFSGAVSPDRSICALGLIFGRARLATWRLVVLNLKTGEAIWDEALSNEPDAMTFGADGRTLACAFGNPRELRLLDLAHRSWSWATAIPGSPTTVAYLQSGVFCVGGHGRNLQLIAADTGRIVAEPRGQSGDISDLACDPVTGQIAAATNTGELRILAQILSPDTRSFTGFWSTAGGDRALCMSDDGRMLAATLDGHRIRIIDAGGGRRQPMSIDGVLAPIRFTKDQKALWAVGLDGTMQLWNLGEEPRLVTSIRTAEDDAQILGASGSADGRWLVAYDSRGCLLSVDTEKRALKARVTADPRSLFWTAVSDDGRFAAASGPSQYVRIWTLPDLQPKGIWHSDQRVASGAFSPNGSVLAVTLNSGIVEFHRTERPLNPIVRTTSSGTAYGLCFHPTEPRIFVGGQDGILHVFNTNDWTEMLQMTAADSGTNPGTIMAETASADGSAVAVYTESGLIRLWRQ